jgi:ligand-binding sensor domain-containing protein
MEVSFLAVDADGDVFAGTDVDTFHSLDGGDSWTSLDNDLAGRLRRITIAPSGEAFGVTSQGLYRSSDKGNTWTVTGFTGDVDRVAFNDAGHIFVGTELEGMYRSTDGGEIWTPINTGLPEAAILRIGVDRLTGHVFVSTWDGVFRSTDNGNSWTGVTIGSPEVVVSFAFDSKGNVFAGTWGGGIHRSTDGGDTSSLINAGLTSLNISSLAVNSRDWVFAGTEDGGVFRSVNAAAAPSVFPL